MTGQDPDPADRERMITYWRAQDGYRSTLDARERYEELTAAIRRAAEPPAGPAVEHEAGK